MTAENIDAGAWRFSDGNARLDFALVATAVFSVVVATTIGLSTTTGESRLLVEWVRGICLSVSLLGLLVLVKSVGGVYRSSLIVLYLCALTLAYGVGLSLINGAFEKVEGTIVRDVFALLIIVFYVDLTRGFKYLDLSIVLSKLIVGYCLVVVLYTYFTGGLVLSFPPQFLNEYLSDGRGAAVQYSQGISKFYAMGAISAFYWLSRSDSAHRLLLAAVVLFFLFLSFVGGARGDSVAALIVLLLLAFVRYRLRILFYIIPIVVLSFAFDFSRYVTDEFVILRRFMALAEGAQVRGGLLGDAIGLLATEPTCLLLGCGFGFFQNYFDYHSGLYPHNFVLESLISLGLLLVVPLFLLAIRGLFLELRDGSLSSLFFWFFVYFLIVSMKSGAMLSSWYVVAGVWFYAAVALRGVRVEVVNGK